jgi:predicted permease
MVVQKSRMLLWLLLGAIFFVLLIACANVATLLLARSAVRKREIAYRIALGATRMRLVRASLVEDLLLAFVGGAAGLILARWGIKGLLAILPASIPRTSEVHMDLSVLGFAFALSALTGLLFGTVPAISLTRVNLNEALKEGSRGQIGARFWKGTRGLLVSAQVALAVVLLTGSSLLVRSFLRVEQVDPGFQSQNRLTLSTALPQAQYAQGAQITSFYLRLLERVQNLPDTASVGFGTSLPMAGGWHRVFEAEGHPAPAAQNMQLIANTAVLGDYFRTLGMSLKAGRYFDESDQRDSSPVVIISAGMARQYWAGEDPIGKRMRFSESLPWMTIVGVVSDVKETGLDEASSPHTYQPYLQLGEDGVAAIGRRMRMIVRTKADPLSAVSDVRAQVQALDGQLPIANVRSMQQIVETSLVPRRFNTLMFAGFGGVGLLLAAAGIYGILAYSVSQRQQELGLRIALGARRNDLLWLTLRDGIRVAIVGIGVGLPAAYGFARLLAGLLYGVRPADPASFLAIVVALLGAALLASFLPARRATKLDAMAALRNE